jgi:hypothetical protein
MADSDNPTCEQQARSMLDQMELVRIVRGEIREPASFSAGDVSELANLFALNHKLRAALIKALNSWERWVCEEKIRSGKSYPSELAQIAELREKFKL